MRRLRTQAGFTAVEVLIASVVMIGVLTATLTMLDNFGGLHKRADALTESVDRTRQAMERLNRDLRDATAYDTGSGQGGSVLVRATATDLVMRRVDPFGAGTASNPHAVQLVRWCLDGAGRLHRQVRAPGAMPSSACPDTSWKGAVIATDVVNGSRPLFSYDAASLADVTSVSAFLALDRDVRKAPAEVTLTSGVFLRNQNRRPKAAFTAVAMPGRSVQLNAATSTDPEGGMLTYKWADGATELAATSPVTTYVAPSAGSRTITLTVTDVGGLSATISQPVGVQP